jgi:FkbM family methyltransferase
MLRKSIKLILSNLGYTLNRNVQTTNVPLKLESFLGFNVCGSKYKFLEKGLPILKELQTKCASNFTYRNDFFYVEINNTNHRINYWEELLILKEIYLEGIYNISFKGNFALIDIGMNVGLTSLFFANQPNCEVVYSFEPFDSTFKLAQENLALNTCAKKISVKNFGLGFPAREILVDFNEEFKGSMGINGMPNFIKNKLESKKEKLVIRDVGEQVNNIVLSYQGTIVAKIDCEGAEYEIIDRLNEQNLLSSISFFMIEWHLKGPNKLKDILNNNGFTVFSFNEKNNDIGMLYATKSI